MVRMDHCSLLCVHAMWQHCTIAMNTKPTEHTTPQQRICKNAAAATVKIKGTKCQYPRAHCEVACR